MKARWWIAAGVALVGVAFTFYLGVVLTNPARRSPPAIRAGLFALAPAGTSIAAVKALLVAHHWDQGKCWTEDEKGNWLEISSHYGGYTPFDAPLSEVNIRVHWHFDEAGSLKNIVLHYHQGRIGFTEIHVEE